MEKINFLLVSFVFATFLAIGVIACSGSGADNGKDASLDADADSDADSDADGDADGDGDGDGDSDAGGASDSGTGAESDAGIDGGTCVDALCPPCELCDTAGECAPVSEGDDPKGDCEHDTSAPCGTTGGCDGFGQCAVLHDGDPCDDDDFCTLDTRCSGGDCVAFSNFCDVQPCTCKFCTCISLPSSPACICI
jgi:hypothetical protein